MSLLKADGLDKRFGLHYALSQISIDIRPGEVHALVGENGAGKSTFIKIITGVYTADGGRIYWNGTEQAIFHPKHARELGINVIHQDRHLIPSFSGMENLFLGMEYPKRKLKIGIHWNRMSKRAEQLKKELGIQLNLKKTAQEMSPSERTILEILRAMMLDCRLLILDEPTASLTDQETELLFKLIHKLTAQGTAILYVSHRMDEIFRLSDRITVLRNGKLAGTVNKSEADKDLLIRMMTNLDIQKSAIQKAALPQNAQTVLKVDRLSTADGRVKNANLTVREGEIVGIFGLAGAGRTELLEAVYGSRPIKEGRVIIGCKTLGKPSPMQSLRQGVVLIPEDRRSDALIMDMSIRENMTLPVLNQFSNGIKILEQAEKQKVTAMMDSMKVRATGTEQFIRELSGGNQQKIVFAKALLSNPVLFLCDEPTQAVDVMTRDEIHRMLKEQAAHKCGIVFVSSDLQEVLDIADRIYVLEAGEMVAELDNDGIVPEQILQICYRRKGSEHGE
ncbi:sugar ABC transporter ATP-binding protein [Paenibacillus beijingensis]|uniref:ABC transporter domain-containing protein n=1 Tax=Paenibacillus beijingensis TaxID=1126833 RepID=A0A0D5NGX3_9BACL|nr:sugar ABC transporter ATP-binding protein [Paenibacillus beijingensis]AJY74158.1 hypothetical protein VN24_05665 [Paenibacillus beijingensis]